MDDGLSLLSAARACPAQEAVVYQGKTFRFGDLEGYVRHVATALVSKGLTERDRVAIRTTSRVETYWVLTALMELGIPFVPLHPRLTPGECKVLIEDAEPALVLDDDDVSELVAVRGESRTLYFARPSPEGLLAMVYTSGTSGRPKGAMLSRRAFVASAKASARRLGWTEDDRWLLCLPLCHVGGLSIVTRCLLARRCVVIEPRFDPEAVLDTIARERVTLLSVVPTMLKALLEHDRNNRLSRLRALVVGGASTPTALLEECARRGILALTTYGLTEACSQVTLQSVRDRWSTEPGSGQALDGTELRIAGESGERLPVGRIGKILVRGPTMMTGYWRQAEVGNDWFDTGDLGWLDEHARLHVVGRRTDLIVTGGENVYPAEVEQALEECPGVRRALVFGVEDDTWGEVVAAALVLDPVQRSSEEVLWKTIVLRLASHKRPRRVCFVDDLPMLPNGKVDRVGGIERFKGMLRPWRQG